MPNFDRVIVFPRTLVHSVYHSYIDQHTLPLNTRLTPMICENVAPVC
jgi:hypothetical protein